MEEEKKKTNTKKKTSSTTKTKTGSKGKTNEVKKTSQVKKTPTKTTQPKKNIIKTKEENKEKEEVASKELEVKKIETKEPISTEEEYYNILEHEKSHIFIKILIVILLLAAGMFIVYKFVIREPKAIFTSGINKIYEKAANNLFKISNSKIFNDKVDINGILTINSDDSYYKSLSNYIFDFDIGFNKDNNNYKILLDVKDSNNKKISSFDYYYLNNNYYLDFKDDYDKVILLKNDILNINNNYLKFTNIDFNKLNTSIKSIKNIINSKIDRNKILTGEEEINNEKFEYVELKLNKDEYSNFVTNIIDDIKNNNGLIDNLTLAFKTNKENIINTLNELQKKNLLNNFNDISFKFYVHGFMANIAGLSIKIDNNNKFYYFDYDGDNNNCDNCIKNIHKLEFTYNNYNIYVDNINNIYNALIKKDSKDYIHLVFNELNDNTIDINYNNYEDNSYGNIHLDKYNESKNKGGNFKFSRVYKNNTTSINIDYYIETNKTISLNNNSYIKVDDIHEDDYVTIENNIIDKINSKALKNYFIDLYESIYKY